MSSSAVRLNDVGKHAETAHHYVRDLCAHFGRTERRQPADHPGLRAAGLWRNVPFGERWAVLATVGISAMPGRLTGAGSAGLVVWVAGTRIYFAAGAAVKALRRPFLAFSSVWPVAAGPVVVRFLGWPMFR